MVNGATNALGAGAVARQLQAVRTGATGEVSRAGLAVGDVAGVALGTVDTDAQASGTGDAGAVSVATVAVSHLAALNAGSSIEDVVSGALGADRRGAAVA